MNGMVRNIMTAAAQHRIQSVALPVLGAGHAQWPLSLAARAQVGKVIKEAHTFLSGTPPTASFAVQSVTLTCKLAAPPGDLLAVHDKVSFKL